MTTWVTSDIHFGHQNILKFNPRTRPFANIQEMNEQYIRDWNSRVQPEDTVYILGDFAFLSPDQAARIAARLNGDKVLIRGNHDTKLCANHDFQKEFVAIHDYLEIEYKSDYIPKTKLVMFHFPIAEWNRCHHGAVHLYGHLHGATSGLERYRAMDVGVDSAVYNDGAIVRLMDDVLEYCLTGEIKKHGNAEH